MTLELKKEAEPRPQVLLIHRAFIKNGNQFLIIQRHSEDRYKPNLWELPGGKLDQNKDLYNTLHDEILEETGLRVEITQPLAHIEGRLLSEGPYSGLAYIGITSICHLTDNPRIILSAEHQNYAWVTINDMTKYDLTSESACAINALSLLS